MKLKDKVAIITGASRGIGKATAQQFVTEGAKVIVNYKNSQKEAEALVSSFPKNQAAAVQADVSSEADVKRLVSEALKTFGRIDILVNNAGEIIRPGDWQTDLATWEKTLEVNLTSAWLMIREVVPVMKKQKSGAIINLNSTVGILGSPFVLPYSCAKGGIESLTKSMAKFLAPNIRVNAVAPSNVMTDMTRGAGEELIERMRQATLLQRIAEPEELAKPILFLASDESSYITGHVLIVDGGYSLK